MTPAEPTDLTPNSRCVAPSGEPATYLGLEPTPPCGTPGCDCERETLVLHAYLVDGESAVSHSRLAPRPEVQVTPPSA